MVNGNRGKPWVPGSVSTATIYSIRQDIHSMKNTKKFFLKSCKDEEVQAELSGKICVVQSAALLQCSVDFD